jgi:thioredoxin-like negative regulator of GroEL
MADIAHQANGSVKALHYLQKALEHGPRLSQYADIGYEIYLANNELTKANQLAKKVFNQWPQSYKWRQRVAESSLWAGNAQYSLPHWVKLWRDRGDKQAYRHAVAIARQTNSYHTLITIYSRKLEDEPQKAQLWLKLANVYAALGRPATAIDKLKNGYQQTGRSDLIERIAYFYQATDCPDKSLDWYKRYVREHGLAVGIAYQIARLNSMLGDDQAAFYWLAKVQNEAAKANHDFWHLYAYLSWQLRHFNHALSSYEQLAETNALTRQEALRLLYLMEQQDPEKAYKRAYQA